MASHPGRGRRCGFTLLELLVVLVLLGLSAAVILPSIRLPFRSAERSPIERARAVAVRRGESVRLTIGDTGVWSVAGTADTAGVILLAGTGGLASGAGAARSVVISALGLCMPEGPAARGTPPWDPARCSPTR